MNLSSRDYYDCNLCRRKGIGQMKLLQHHMKWHRDIPYQLDQFTLAKNSQTQFQCKVCQDIVDGSEREEHQRTVHPMFKTHTGLFYDVNVTHDVRLGVDKWSDHKDASKVKCMCCKKKIDQKGFFEHIQRDHPDCLKPFSTNVTAQPSVNTQDSVPPSFNTKATAQPTFGSVPPSNTETIAQPSFSSAISQPQIASVSPFNAGTIAQPLLTLMPTPNIQTVAQPSFNNAANVLNLQQTFSQRQDFNHIFATQQSSLNAMDYNLNHFYDCTLCSKKEINQTHLLKHHKKFHRNIPYRLKQYTLEKSVRLRYQCKVCQEIVDDLERAEHQRKKHPMFQRHKGLFYDVKLTRYVKLGVEKWSKNKDTPEVVCMRLQCKMKIDQKNFIEHVQRQHPKCLIESFRTKAIAQPSINTTAVAQPSSSLMLSSSSQQKKPNKRRRQQRHRKPKTTVPIEGLQNLSMNNEPMSL